MADIFMNTLHILTHFSFITLMTVEETDTERSGNLFKVEQTVKTEMGFPPRQFDFSVCIYNHYGMI